MSPGRAPWLTRGSPDWGLGAFGCGLTGILETHTQEDLRAHAALIVLWGAT